MKQFDRAELDEQIFYTSSNTCINCEDGTCVHCETDKLCAALALALAVVDAAMTQGGWYCYICRRHIGDNSHEPDCPVKACVEKGLTK